MLFRNAGPTIPPEVARERVRAVLPAGHPAHAGNAELGLAIAKEIVEAHGGAITAESAHGSFHRHPAPR